MILILTTTDKKQTARKIASSLLRQKLVACVSILPIGSSYWWKGRIVNAKEYQLILKTKTENYEKVEDEIKKIHNYTVPEIISFNVQKVSKEYLSWLTAELE